MLDLEGVAAYIAVDSPHFAAVTCDRIVRAVERLAEFPRSGRVVPEYDDPAIREVIWKNYRVVYKLMESNAQVRGDERVAVLAVVHGARLLPDDVRGRAST